MTQRPKGSYGSTEDEHESFPTVNICSSVVGHSDSSDVKSSNSSGDTGRISDFKSKSRRKPPKQLSFSSADLFKNVQMAAARGTKAVHRNHPISLPDDGDTVTRAHTTKETDRAGSSSLNKHSNVNHSLREDVTKAQGDNAQNTQPQHLQTSPESPKTKLIPDHKPPDSNVTSNFVSSYQSFSTLQSMQSPEGKATTSPASLSHGMSQDNGIKRTCTVDKHGLVEADLYVQGHGDLAMVLVMERGKARDKDTLRSMVS